MKKNIFSIVLMLLFGYACATFYSKCKGNDLFDFGSSVLPQSEWHDALIGKWEFNHVFKYREHEIVHKGVVEYFPDGTFTKEISIKQQRPDLFSPKVGATAGGGIKGTWMLSKELNDEIIDENLEDFVIYSSKVNEKKAKEIAEKVPKDLELSSIEATRFTLKKGEVVLFYKNKSFAINVLNDLTFETNDKSKVDAFYTIDENSTNSHYVYCNTNNFSLSGKSYSFDELLKLQQKAEKKHLKNVPKLYNENSWIEFIDSHDIKPCENTNICDPFEGSNIFGTYKDDENHIEYELETFTKNKIVIKGRNYAEDTKGTKLTFKKIR